MNLDDARAFCRAEGAQACNNGVSEEECPYPSVVETAEGQVDLASEWRAGWRRAAMSGASMAFKIMREARTAALGKLHAFIAWLGLPIFFAEDVSSGLVLFA